MTYDDVVKRLQADPESPRRAKAAGVSLEQYYDLAARDELDGFPANDDFADWEWPGDEDAAEEVDWGEVKQAAAAAEHARSPTPRGRSSAFAAHAPRARTVSLEVPSRDRIEPTQPLHVPPRTVRG